MKLTKKITAVLLLVIIIGALTGCAELLGMLLPMSIDERIAAFSLSLNSDSRTADEILLHFGPSADMIYYDAAGYDSYWENAFPADNQYVFTVADKTDPDAVAVNAVITASSGGTITSSYTFMMYQETSGNYLIQEIWEGAETIIRKIDL